MNDLIWWNKAFYKIDIKNFYDYNNDGFGDILGIVNKLSYFKEMSIKVLLLHNFLASDIKGNPLSFNVLDKNIGTIEDFSLLLEKAKEEGIKIVLELPLVYTSVESYWFQESAESKKSFKANWYIWQDFEDKKDKEIWKYSENRKQYYLSRFKENSADLNWNFFEVRKKIANNLRYWQTLGVDGFVFSDVEYFHYHQEKNAEKQELQNIEFIKYFADIAKEKQNFFTMGNFHNETKETEKVLDNSIDYVSKMDKLISVNIENFWENLLMEKLPSLLYKISNIFLDTYISLSLPNKETFFEKYEEKKFLYTFLIFTFRCIPIIKYGDELDYKNKQIFKWSSWDRNFGFNSGLTKPYKEINKEENSLDLCRKDKNSYFNFLKQMLKIREEISALSLGLYQEYLSEKEVLAYIRQDDHYKILVAINFSDKEQKINLDLTLKEINLENSQMAVFENNVLILPKFGFYLAEILN